MKICWFQNENCETKLMNSSQIKKSLHKHNCDKFVYEKKPDFPPFETIQLENYLKFVCKCNQFCNFYY